MTSQPVLRLVRNGVWFPVRHHSLLLSCGKMHGFLLAEAQSAIDLLGCQREDLLGLVCVVPQPRAG
jgi:hypothetical protein